MNWRLRTLLFLAPILTIHFVGSAVAQDPEWFEPRAAWRDYQERHENRLRARWDDERGVPRLIWGSAIPCGVDTSDEVSLDFAARGVIDDLVAVLGFCSEALELVEIRQLRLSRVGSSDKVAVLYRQGIAGVSVHRGTVTVLFSAGGDLLAVDSSALPHAAFAPIRPEVPLELALQLAGRSFAARTGLTPSPELLDPSLVLFPVENEQKLLRAELAWMIHVAGETDPSVVPVARGYAVAARGRARVFDSWTTVHEAGFAPQSTGTTVDPTTQRQHVDPARTSDLSTTGWGQPGLLPDGYEPNQLFPLKDLRITDSLGNPYGFSDEDGETALPISAPTLLGAFMDGRYTLVWDWWNGSPSDIPAVFGTATPGQTLFLTFNDPASEQQAANVNVFRGVQRFRDWIREIDPTETLFDFPVFAQVNGTPCVAYFTGGSMRFGRASAGMCPNMAFSTIVWHEEGHWANELYGSGNGPDGFGEGAADSWSVYVGGDAIVGRHSIWGMHMRHGWTTRRFCGDAYRGCYGDLYDDGEVLLGALWKVRARLQADLGEVSGAAVANALFLSWFQAFDDGEISTLIRDHWLVLDDDDGNPDNGTPHEEAIRCGFTAQGFPTGMIEVAGLLPSQPSTILYLGQAIDLDGDRLVAGAGGDYSTPSVAGAAYVFLRDAAGWTEEARIVPSDSTGRDGFGRAVELDGDTLVVGAPWRTEGTEVEAGAVYVFVRQGSSWVEQSKLTTSAPEEDDRFGNGVALQGDRLVIGAPNRHGAGSSSGMVFVFERSGTTWSQTAELESPVDHGMGYSVSLEGDWLVAGAPGYRKAHTFAFDGLGWSFEATLESGGPYQELFGYSVSLSGDTLAVGAPALGTGPGSAYTYDRSTGSWTAEAHLTPPGGEDSDFFGYDLELDTHGLIVGAMLADDLVHDGGEAFFFARIGSGWELRSLLRPGGTPGVADSFGCGVTLDGPWIGVSAPGSDEVGTATGKVHVFGPDNPFELYGAGTVGYDSLAPALWACGDASPGGTVSYHVHAGVPGGTGDFYVGSTRDSTPFYGGTMLVGNITSMIPVALDALGSATHTIVIPNDPLLVGTSVNVQYWGVDFAAFGDHAGSNGLEYVIQP